MKKLSIVLLLLAAMFLAGCDTLANSVTALQTSVPRAQGPTPTIPRGTPRITPTPGRGTPVSTPKAGTPGANSVDAYVPADVLLRYRALAAQGYTTTKLANGFYALGAANAPVTIEQFSSYACPPCKAFNDTSFYNLFDMILAGQVKYVFVPITSTGAFDSTLMASATFCAGEQGQYWPMHDVMFDWQTRYGNKGNDAGRLSSAAAQLGIDQGQFATCMGGSAPTQFLQAAGKLFEQRGLNATPSVFLNNELLDRSITLVQLRADIDAALKKR